MMDQGSGDNVVQFPVRLRRYRFRDSTALPQRRWLVRGLILRGHVTAIIAAGGAGKSMFGLAMALHMCAGRAFGAFRPRDKYRVAVLTVEEDEEELDRRLHALQKEFGFDNDDASRLLIINIDDPPLLAIADRKGTMHGTKKLESLEQELASHGTDCVVLDPFIELWSGMENDNNQVKAAAGFIRAMCRRLDAGCMLMHHVRKGTVTPGDMDAGRGGSAFGGLVRLAFTLSNMKQEDAEALGIPSPKGIIRIDHAKGNYSPDPGAANWYKFKSVDLGNETEWNPDSDKVGILVPWVPPGAFENVTYDQINIALDRINIGFEDGDRYTFAAQSRDRYVVVPIAEALEIAEERAELIARIWRKSGLLFEQQYHSPRYRKLRSGVYVDAEKRPSALAEDT